MVKEVEVSGYEAFQKAADENKDKVVFALFCGDVDDQGKSWCPDCVVAEPVVMRNLKSAPEDAIFIHCKVGPRDFWKDQSNIFRTDPNLALKSVPTLLRMGKPQRLEEAQCAKDDMVQMLLEED
ncbi:thioredoxin domain-containing protein 17-like [Haliotis cracherodii]|uniref:thioredoxin domain-containing protein 17-like n=1 Tax=Haliotis cracherodii TaxID=6455 RepID=UPI0039EB300A